MKDHLRWSRNVLFWTLLLTPGLWSVPTARAEESYFVLIFSWQRGSTQLRCTHTFATFVRVCDGPSPADPPVLEAHTISWLPERMTLHPWRMLPQRGHNFDLDTSLRFAMGHNDRVCLWGPFQVRMELYDLAQKQVERLERGNLHYKVIDAGYAVSSVSNCVHAVLDLIPPQGRIRFWTPGWGEGASKTVAGRLKPWMIDPCTIHPWIADCLGLDRYPITRRALLEP